MNKLESPALRQVIHIINDGSLGGVTLALKNFEHPMLSEHFKHC